MSKKIDLSRGYDALSDDDKLYLAQRGELPSQHLTPELAARLDVSGRPSTVAYGANTGSIRNVPTEDLKAELERRWADQEIEDPRELMPDLDNPHSERLEQIEKNRDETSRTDAKRHAAAKAAAAGPAVPTRGHPAKDAGEMTAEAKKRVADVTSDDDDDEEELTYHPDVESYVQDMDKAELVAEADARGLSVEGNKKDIAERIVAWNEENGFTGDDDES